LLLTEAVSFDPELQKYLDFGRKLTAFYYEERYPPGLVSSYPIEEIEEMLTIAKEVINRLNETMCE